MKMRNLCLVMSMVMLALLVFQQESSAQQCNDLQKDGNSSVVASFIDSDVIPCSAVQDSMLIRGQNKNEVGCSIGCEEDCCESCDSCVCSCRKPKWRAFGDFLYLRPRNAEVAYAVPFNGPVTPPDDVPIQVGRIAMVDPEFTPAFRAGFACNINECASLGLTYSQLDSSTSDSISVNAPLVLRSMTIHPSTLNATEDWLSASASYYINFKLADIDYRRVFACCDLYSWSYLVGMRYGRLEQRMQSTFTEIGTENINTKVDFDGAGIRLGLEGERHARCSGFLIYGKSTANFLAGEFRANYFQGSSVDPEIVNTSWKAGRVVSMLELELGVGWASPKGCFRVTGGYMVNAWYNTVRTADWIGAVQHNDFAKMNDKLTFDGLVARAELRY